jgi:hypothetical protein
VTPTPAPATPASALPAGTYTSRSFAPAVTFTLPDGWTNPTDTGTYLALYPAGNDLAGVHLFRDPQAASQAETCPSTAEPGVGTLSSELAAWIRERPGLDVSTPRMVTVGGLRGVELDVRIRSGWAASCPFADGIPTVPLFVGRDGDLRWVVAGSERCGRVRRRPVGRAAGRRPPDRREHGVRNGVTSGVPPPGGTPFDQGRAAMIADTSASWTSWLDSPPKRASTKIRRSPTTT